jgi:Ca2+-binding EF-hand superfamily protein
MEEEDGNSSVYSDEYNEDGNEENIKMASWDLISKYFSLDALNKFEFLFKVINLKGDGIISNTEFDDFSYGVGIDLKTTNFEAIYKACTHGENEMDLAEFLIFIYQLKNAGNQDFVSMMLEQAELQFDELRLQGESDVDSDEENEERLQLRAQQQAKRVAKLEGAKAEALQNNDARPLQPFFPKLYAKYRPATLGENPLIPEGMMELVHTLAENEFDAVSTMEKMDNLVKSRESTRQAEMEVREKYEGTFTPDEITKYISQFRAVDDDGSGQIDEEELGEIFKKIGMKIEKDELKLMFQEVDEDGSGEVDLDEYLGMLKKVKEGDNSEIARKLAEAALLAEKLKKKEEAAKRAARAKEATRRAAIFAKFKKKQLEEFQKQFNTFDADGSGEIDFDEMKAMVRGLGMDTPGHVLKKLMKSIDTDGDGTLSFVEFLEMMDKGKSGPMAEMFNKIANRQQNMNEERRLQLKKEQAKLKRKQEEQAKLKAEKAAMRAWAVKQLTVKEVKGLEKGFKVIDADGSDSIDEDELFNLMKLLKINMPRDKLRKLVKEVDIDRSGALDFSEFLVLAAKAKEGGKYASAFQEIVNAQSRALDSGSVRSQLEKMKEKQRKDKLSASLERENSAAQRNRKLKEDLARKKRNDNQLKSKKVQIRQSQLTNKEERKVKKVARHIDAKDKRIQSRKAKMEEDKRLEREVATKKRKQRAMQARKKAEAIQNQY